MSMIEYGDFKKLDIRIGTVVEAIRVPGTEKLFKMQVDVGRENPIQIVSSLVPFYTAEDLLHARIVVLVNLQPTKFRGELSEGMLLAAETDDESECVLLTTLSEIANGTKIT